MGAQVLAVHGLYEIAAGVVYRKWYLNHDSEL